jgi:hypothetical protein
MDVLPLGAVRFVLASSSAIRASNRRCVSSPNGGSLFRSDIFKRVKQRECVCVCVCAEFCFGAKMNDSLVFAPFASVLS